MKTYRWLIEIEVSQEDVQRGFDLSNLDTQEDILDVILPWTCDDNKSLKLIKKPTKKELEEATR